MEKKRVLIPVPSYGFDPTEVAVPWLLLSKKDIEVVFATPNGEKAKPDTRMLTGDGLGVCKKILMARNDAADACKQMDKSAAFSRPLHYADVNENNFDAIVLPGGHDKSVREYLESAILQRLTVSFFTAEKPVAAICHGVVLAARSIDPLTKKPVIHDYKTTCLLKTQELLAYHLTRWWLKDYYLTYPGLTVEDEVKSALCCSDNFIKGPLPLLRDSTGRLNRGFFVKDRNYLSARWPGDVYNFSLEFIRMVQDFKK